MSNRCGCSDPGVIGCGCDLVDSDCMNVSGAGTSASPYTVAPIVSGVTGQLLSCGADGLLASKADVRPNVRVRERDQIALANATETTHPFDTERWDAAVGMHSGGADSRITITDPGIYFFFANIWFGQPNLVGDVNGGIRYARLRKNGTDYIATRAIPGAYGGSGINVATAVRMSATDYMEVRVYQSSGTGTDRVTRPIHGACEFGALKLGNF